MALSEALYWVDWLDDQAENTVSNYFAQRYNDPRGRTVGGLIYVRNMHAHVLVSTG